MTAQAVISQTGRKPKLLVFSCQGSNDDDDDDVMMMMMMRRRMMMINTDWFVVVVVVVVVVVFKQKKNKTMSPPFLVSKGPNAFLKKILCKLFIC